LKDQEQQFFPSIDLDLGPHRAFNFGAGRTGSTDQLIIKCLLGRRLSRRHDDAKLKTSTKAFGD
jgi:hypothetical protein